MRCSRITCIWYWMIRAFCRAAALIVALILTFARSPGRRATLERSGGALRADEGCICERATQAGIFDQKDLSFHDFQRRPSILAAVARRPGYGELATLTMQIGPGCIIIR